MKRRQLATAGSLAATLVAGLLSLVGGQATAMAEPLPAPGPLVETAAATPLFTFDRVAEAAEEFDRQVAVQRETASADPTAPELGLHTVEAAGVVAAANTSLIRDGEGAASAATPRFVDLSWSPMDGVESYAVERAGELVATTTETALRVTDVTPGEQIDFRISAISAEDSVGDTPVFGLHVEVPQGAVGEDSAQQQVSQSAAQAVRYDNAYLDWYTFIPMDRVDIPPVGCEYGSGYQFGGDDRGFAATPSQSSILGYRTWIAGNIAWSRGSGPVLTSSFFTPTSVYDADTGEEVDFAGNDGNPDNIAEMNVLDSSTEFVDIRVRLQGHTAFCPIGNSVEGAFTITVTRAGNYAILSGQHRQMPNHEIFLTSFGAGNSTIVYQRRYLDPTCLVNWACPPAEMGGYQGTY